MSPTLTSLSLSGMRKQSPVNNRLSDMNGNENNRRGLLPNLSIVKRPGSAPKKLSMPKPHEANNALILEKPAWVNIVAV